jgi:serine phosphatase RsbU (regulator of sigma subunit)
MLLINTFARELLENRNRLMQMKTKHCDMSDFNTIWQFFEKSEDPTFIVENNMLVRWNNAADKILKDGDFENTGKFNLARLSPEFQSCGIKSAEKEKEFIEIAAKKNFYRFEWMLRNPDNENFFVEVTTCFVNNKGKTFLYLILRDITLQKQNLKLLESLRTEIMLKNEEIEMQSKKIESQKEKNEIQRDLAERQRDEISAQKKALTDSIRYASRIQSALQPESKSLSQIFSDYFILNKPKDIVSGDFYWISTKEDKTVVAVADSTGHGVPGAFMSLLGIEFLEEIVENLGITQPDKILDNLRDRIIKSMGQTGRSGETCDGMDMALIFIDLANYSLQYAGAFNPLFVIRNNNIIVIKGDKMPVGYQTRTNNPFTNHDMQIKPNDSIYLFTDGYPDQFGWRTGKKFYIHNFRELLLSIQNVPMKAQKILLENNLKNWMGDLEQVDDIMVIGLQI